MSRIVLILVVVLGAVGVSSAFIVTETEYAIKFQLGRIVRADYTPGLYFKVPFINNVRKFDNRLLTLDTAAEKMLTSEQKFVAVDSFVKWHITDVSRFYTATQGNERIALARLDSIVKDRIRRQIASRTLVEVISEQRVSTMQDIAREANTASADLGIEVVDVRIKAIELPDDVRESVHRRMAADRGAGDALSTEIYANAYNQDPEFFAFYRSLQAYGMAFGDGQDVMVIDPSSEFFDYFGSEKAGQQR